MNAKGTVARAEVFETFGLRIQEVVRQAGGRDDLDTSIYDSVIPATRCGPLFVSANASHRGPNVGWIACRFLYPELAVEVFGDIAVNPCSGKWNHHFGSIPVSKAVDSFRGSLSKVLIADAGLGSGISMANPCGEGAS